MKTADGKKLVLLGIRRKGERKFKLQSNPETRVKYPVNSGYKT